MAPSRHDFQSPEFRITAPEGCRIGLRDAIHPNDDENSALASPEARRLDYLENGYVVIRGLIPPAACDAAVAAFRTEVKPYQGFLYRQATANPERHVFSPGGFMLNSLLNVQDLNAHRFPAFRQCGMDVITSGPMQEAVAGLLGQTGKVVNTMYFEGNPATWAHQDSYYLDGEPIGCMTAAWIALEDIHPDAGQFYVYPGSHLIDMARNGGDFDIAFNHDRYKSLVLDVVRRAGLQPLAPSVFKGDVLFWAAKTIHGSLPTADPHRSRNSMTAHFIPESSRFLQYQTRPRPLRIERFNGMQVHCPKNQNRLSRRLILSLETRFPKLFRTAKRLAIKATIR